MTIRRGDVVLVRLDPVLGSEQGKTRPCLVVQNDVGNQFASTTIVAAITSNTGRPYPFTVSLNQGEGNLPKDSLVLCNQIRTISKSHRIAKNLGRLGPKRMRQVDDALKVSLGLSV